MMLVIDADDADEDDAAVTSEDDTEDEDVMWKLVFLTSIIISTFLPTINQPHVAFSLYEGRDCMRD